MILAEIASGCYHSDASTAAFIASDTFAVAAAVEEDSKIASADRTLSNAPLTARISLPPGRTVTRWFVINTSEGRLPAKFFTNYTASGHISGAKKSKYVELIKEELVFLSKKIKDRPRQHSGNDIWGEDLQPENF